MTNISHIVRLILILALFSLIIISCKKNQKEEIITESAIVKVNDKVLTWEMLNKHIPIGLASEDSILLAEHFIQNWATDNLLYEQASNNIANKDSVELLVDNYRKSLVVYQYQEQLVNERLSCDISLEEVLSYFSANKDKFQLDRVLIKGLFLKVPVDAPTIDKVRTWVKSASPFAIQNIEMYCVRNAIPYNYITDDWIDFNELTFGWPIPDETDSFKYKKFIEGADDRYHYFIYIKDYLLPGDNAPFGYAQTAAKEILINQKKIEFLKRMEEELYQKAISDGRVVFFKKNN